MPVLVDGDLVLNGAEAILAYLARRYDPMDHWLPADDPVLFGQVMTWLFFAAEALRPAALARLNAMFEVEADSVAVIGAAKAAFRIMDDHMTAREFDGGAWFVGRTPTLADIALFPSIALSRDAGIEHDAYPALRRWMRRVRGIPGFQDNARHSGLSLIRTHFREPPRETMEKLTRFSVAPLAHHDPPPRRRRLRARAARPRHHRRPGALDLLGAHPRRTARSGSPAAASPP